MRIHFRRSYQSQSQRDPWCVSDRETLLCGEHFETVSYTHLDVYKRQALYLPYCFVSIHWLIANVFSRCSILFLHFCQKTKQLHGNPIRAAVLLWLYSVAIRSIVPKIKLALGAAWAQIPEPLVCCSTDVYKRQAQARIFAFNFNLLISIFPPENIFCFTLLETLSFASPRDRLYCRVSIKRYLYLYCICLTHSHIFI